MADIRRLTGAYELVGTIDEYRDPAGVIGNILHTLIRDYLAKGGSMDHVELVIEEVGDPKPHLVARLAGWGRQ